MKFILLLLCLLVNTGVEAQPSQDFQRLLKKYEISPSDLGIYIIEEGSNHKSQVLYQLNPNRLMVPASLSKIPTAGVVLSHLGLDFRYKTTLWADAPIQKGVLKGNLYLKGGGDPSFVSEKMWFLVNELHRTGLKKIEGDIIVDDSVFDGVRFAKGRRSQRGDRAYDAPNGGMSFNWNTINVFVRPSLKGGSKAQVFLDPKNPWVKLINKTKTSMKKTNLQVTRKVKGQQVFVEVRGDINIKSEEKVFYKNIPFPALWAGFNLRSFLQQRSMVVAGRVKKGQVSSLARPVAEVESKSLAYIVADMMKFSNNYVAEMLTKSISLKRPKKTVGDLNYGVQHIENFLKNKIGLKKEDFHLISPSGLSYKNKITAKGLARVMSFFQRNFQVSPEFLSSFPVAGLDGTLKKRMKKLSKKGITVRAKTGYLSGVVSLAGFVSQNKKKKIRSFVFLYNGKSSEFKVRKMFDDLVLLTAEL